MVVQHLRGVEAGAHRLADLAQGLELLHGASQRGGSGLELLEETGVLDGDHRLVGERLEQGGSGSA